MQGLMAAAHIEDEVRLALLARIKNISVAGMWQPDEFSQREASLEFRRGFQISDETWIETLDGRGYPDPGHHGLPRVDDEVRAPST